MDFINSISKDKVKLVILLAAAILVVFNLYYYSSETYARVTDNYFKDDEPQEAVSIRYSDILKNDESFSNQISMYMIEQPADEDSLLMEKTGVLLLLAGSIVTGVAILMLLRDGNILFVVIGAIASAIGSVILNGVYTGVKDAIDESLLGTIGMIFGQPLTFYGTSRRLMLFNLVLGGIICIASYFYIHRPQAQGQPQAEGQTQPQTEGENQTQN